MIMYIFLTPMNIYLLKYRPSNANINVGFLNNVGIKNSIKKDVIYCWLYYSFMRNIPKL